MTALGASAALIVFLVKLYASRSDDLPLDDSFIQWVYVRHLAESGRFYWNQFDGNVDGFTSLLDTVLKAALVRLFGPLHIIDVAWWSTLGFTFASLGATAMLASHRCRHRGAWRAGFVFIAVTSVALQEGYAYSVVFMLETPLLTALLLTLVAVLRRSGAEPPLPVVLALLVAISLTRPEGMLVSACALAATLWVLRREVSRRAAAAMAAVWALALCGYLLWHMRLFGYWAPNTYYAKTSANRWNEVRDGAWYVLGTAREPAQIPIFLWVFVAPILFFSGRWDDEQAKRAFVVANTLGLAILASVVVGGGDCYLGARFLLPTLSLAAVSLVLASSHVAGKVGILARWTLAAAAASALLGRIPRKNPGAALRDNWAQALRAAHYLTGARALSWQGFFARPMPGSDHFLDANVTFDCHRRMAEAVARAAGRGSVAQSDYQMVKYFVDDARVVDLMGLNDKQLAHEPVSGRVRWGKFSIGAALRADADIWLYGPGWVDAGAIKAVELFRYQDALSMGATRAPSCEETEMAARRYTHVAMPIVGCGTFRFLARRELVPGLANKGIREIESEISDLPATMERRSTCDTAVMAPTPLLSR